MLLVACKGT